MFKKELKILSLSDVHFGNKRIDSYTIALNLIAYFLPRIKESNFIILGGDIFDTMLSVEGPQTNAMLSVFIDILKEAEKYNVTIRVLRGTFSHDRNQNKIFQTLHERYGFTNSLRYVDVLSCEYIDPFGIRVLYMPDDLPYKDSEDCVEAIKELLLIYGWDKVDYVFGHGYFSHRVPENVKHKPKVTFEIEQFRSIVARYILMGHVHTHVAREFVIDNGSFERLAHGEEEAKGFISIVDDGKNAKIQFVENLSATKFMTVDLCQYTDIDSCIKKYCDYVDQYPKDTTIYIRIVHESNEVRTTLRRLTHQQYQHVVFSIKPLKEHNAPLRTHQLLDLSSASAPTKENLPNLIKDYLTSTLTEKEIKALDGPLPDLIEIETLLNAL